MGGLIRCLCQALSCKCGHHSKKSLFAPTSLWPCEFPKPWSFQFSTVILLMAPCFCGSKAPQSHHSWGGSRSLGRSQPFRIIQNISMIWMKELNRLTYEDWTRLYKLVDVHQSSIRLNTKRMHPSIAKSASSRDKGSFLGALTIDTIAHDHDQTDTVSPHMYLNCLHFCSWPIKHLGKTKGFIHLGHLSVGLLALTLRLGWRAKSAALKNLWSAAKMCYICS